MRRARHTCLSKSCQTSCTTSKRPMRRDRASPGNSALRTPLEPVQTMDVRYINPFLTAVGLVFRTMADMSVCMGRPHMKDMHKPMDRIYSLAAVIELHGSIQ